LKIRGKLLPYAGMENPPPVSFEDPSIRFIHRSKFPYPIFRYIGALSYAGGHQNDP
jgi:hypothetical protein